MKAVAVDVDLDGGTMEGILQVKPFESGQILPVPEKEGYDFIGWLSTEDKYFARCDGTQLYSVKEIPNKLTASFIPKKYYAEINGNTVNFVDTYGHVSYEGTSWDSIWYSKRVPTLKSPIICLR